MQVRGEFQCRDFAGRLGCRLGRCYWKMLLPDGARNAFCKSPSLSECQPMHQYEVLGSTRVCILISRSEALLRELVGEEQIENFECGEMACLLQHTSSSGGKNLFFLLTQLRPIMSRRVFRMFAVSLLPEPCMQRKNKCPTAALLLFRGPKFCKFSTF